MARSLVAMTLTLTSIKLDIGEDLGGGGEELGGGGADS